MRSNKMHCKFLLATVLLFGLSLFLDGGVSAQKTVKVDNKPLHIRVLGRAFFDAGFFMNDTLSFGNTVQVNDVRLGTIVSFLDNWEAKVELGYANSKVTFKDVFLGYKYKEHSFRLGYQFEPFGNARIGTTNYRFMQNATADAIFGNGRKIGISYSYNQKWWNVMAGVYSAADIQGSDKMDQGYSLAAKVIGRPVLDEGKVIHLAVAPRFSSDKDVVTFKGGVPTMLLGKGENGMLDVAVDDVINQWKLDCECIMACNKWYFQGQYYLVHLNRSTEDNFTGKGGYAQMGFLILGDHHNYKAKTGMLVNPDAKSLELLVRYNNVNLNNSGIVGGRMSDITVGMSYFLNKYVGAKINYTRMMAGNTAVKGGDFDLIQARIQVSF